MSTPTDIPPQSPASPGSAPLDSQPAVESGESSGLVGVGGAKIVVFRPATDFPLERRHKTHCQCSSVGEKYPSGVAPSVWVDEAMRDIECRKCGARMEAFDYIWMLATEGESLTGDLQRMREEKKTLKAQIDLLNEQIRELKAEGRKLAKAPKKEAGGGGAEPVTIDFRRHEGEVPNDEAHGSAGKERGS